MPVPLAVASSRTTPLPEPVPPRCVGTQPGVGFEFVEPAAKAFERLQRATAWLAQESMKNPDEAGAGATDYLHLFGYTALAYLWARMAKIAVEKRKGKTDVAFYETKLATARFYMQRMLPRSGGHFATLMAGSKTLMEFPDDAF